MKATERDKELSSNLSILEKQFLFGWRLCWINQPSKSQRWNHLHGMRVWSRDSDDRIARVLYPGGYKLSYPRCIPRSALAEVVF